MSRYLLLIALFIAPVFAASWEGERGPFTISAYTVPGGIIGFADLTLISVRCADTTITNARIVVTWADIFEQQHSFTDTTEITLGNGGLIVALPVRQILGVRITARKDAGEY